MDSSVQLMATCILDTLYPEVAEAVVQILEQVGLHVEFPLAQTCCGQPAYNAGMRSQARQMAEHTVQVFEKSPSSIVIPSGSCAAMVRHGYKELFQANGDWSARVEALARRTYEFTEYLVDVLGITDVGAYFPGKITYHTSCHLLRDLGVDRQPKKLLASIRGSEFSELAGSQECCGFGGLFSIEHPEISAAMLQSKLDKIIENGADWVVSCDAGCQTHINGGLHRRGKPGKAIHIAQILSSTEKQP